MCGRSTIACSPRDTEGKGFRNHRIQDDPGRASGSPDLGEERISAKARIVYAMSVLTPVMLSGVFLVVFVPQLWWIFTTYFWIAFPALGSLRQGLVDALGERPHRLTDVEVERELLVALRRHGELTSGSAAAETSLSVAAADKRLGELAGEGHLEVRVRGSAIFYALWEAEPEVQNVHHLASREDGP